MRLPFASIPLLTLGHLPKSHSPVAVDAVVVADVVLFRVPVGEDGTARGAAGEEGCVHRGTGESVGTGEVSLELGSGKTGIRDYAWLGPGELTSYLQTLSCTQHDILQSCDFDSSRISPCRQQYSQIRPQQLACPSSPASSPSSTAANASPQHRVPKTPTSISTAAPPTRTIISHTTITSLKPATIVQYVYFSSLCAGVAIIRAVVEVGGGLLWVWIWSGVDSSWTMQWC